MKLNLGCGSKILDGFVNVDKFDYYPVDVVHDLEEFPYPFETNSVDYILLSHVLEHIGQNPDVFNGIVKELFRVCKPGAKVEINVPHPRHDDFLADPTHVRPIMPLGLALFDKEKNQDWAQTGASNTPLGLIHNVDFVIESVNFTPDKKYLKMLQNKEVSEERLFELAESNNNVIKQIDIIWKARK